MKTKGKLSCQVFDVDTGGKLAARIYLKDRKGRKIIPDACWGNVEWWRYFWVDGGFEVALPPGEFSIIACHGFEYEIFRRKIVVRAGTTTRVAIGLKRWINMNQMGWYSGDMHMHLAHGGPGYHPYMEAGCKDGAIVTKAEDINVGNFLSGVLTKALARQGHTAGWKTRKPLIIDKTHLLNFDPELTGASHGHMCPLGLGSDERWYGAGQDTVHVTFTNKFLNHSPGWPPNSVICDYVHKKGGIVSVAHPITGRNYWPGGDSGCPQHLLCRSLPLDIASAKIDGFDAVCSHVNLQQNLGVYYRILNCGFRLALTEGTDNTLDGGRALFGLYKFYVNIGAEHDLNVKNFADGIRRGRTFVTNGPLVFLTVDDAGIGDCLRLKQGGAKVKVRLSLNYNNTALHKLTRVSLIRNGREIKSYNLRRDMAGACWQKEFVINVRESCWLAARCDGVSREKDVVPEKIFAHTSPVYIEVDRHAITSAEDAAFFLKWLDNFREEVEGRSNWVDIKHRQVMLAAIKKAEKVYRRQIGKNKFMRRNFKVALDSRLRGNDRTRVWVCHSRLDRESRKVAALPPNLEKIFKKHPVQGGNLIKNSDFAGRRGKKRWKFVIGNQAPARGRIFAEGKTGGVEIELDRDDIGDRAYFRRDGLVLQPKVVYEMGAKIKMISERNVGHHGLSCAYVSLFDSNGGEMARSSTVDQTGETPWLEINGRFCSDSKPQKVSFRCELFRVKGKIVFKDLYLRETNKNTVSF